MIRQSQQKNKNQKLNRKEIRKQRKEKDKGNLLDK
jgi:hypothetical protein